MFREIKKKKKAGGGGGDIKINIDYAWPHQVNVNLDYLLMGWGSGWIKANTWSSAVSRDKKKKNY